MILSENPESFKILIMAMDLDEKLYSMLSAAVPSFDLN